MASKDTLMLGLLGIGGLALAMWYGDKLVKDASNSFAKGLQLPALPLSGGVNVTLPSFSPNITVQTPDITKYGDYFKAAAEQTYNTSPIGSGLNTLQVINDFVNQQLNKPQVQAPLYTVNQHPIYSVPVSQVKTIPTDTGSFLPDITGILQKGLTLKEVKPQPNKSTSEGGNGIRVENGDNDYYVEDKSLYGDKGMPAPQQPAPILPSVEQGYYGKSGEERAVADSKAAALKKIEEYEKLYGVKLPRD